MDTHHVHACAESESHHFTKLARPAHLVQPADEDTSCPLQSLTPPENFPDRIQLSATVIGSETCQASGSGAATSFREWRSSSNLREL